MAAAHGFDWSAWVPEGPSWLPLAVLVATFALEVAETVRGQPAPPTISVDDCLLLCERAGSTVAEWGGTSCRCVEPEPADDTG